MQQLFYWSSCWFVSFCGFSGCEKQLSTRNYTNEEDVVNHLVETSDTGSQKRKWTEARYLTFRHDLVTQACGDKPDTATNYDTPDTTSYRA